LYSEIRATYKSEGPTEANILSQYCDVPVLALDDLAGGSLSDYERRTTLNLLDRRWNEKRPTVVTCNWSLEEIGERMDARISSRLRGCAAIILGGHDRRARR
jgi:DNA replication protein DnaC